MSIRSPIILNGSAHDALGTGDKLDANSIAIASENNAISVKDNELYVADAPNDGITYAKQNGLWVNIQSNIDDAVNKALENLTTKDLSNYYTKDDVDKKISELASSSGQLEYTLLYPGGSENNAPTITRGERVSVPNPYGHMNCLVILEIRVDGIWGVNNSAVYAAGGHGTLANIYGSNIIIQVGSGSAIALAKNGVNAFGKTANLREVVYRVRVIQLIKESA